MSAACERRRSHIIASCVAHDVSPRTYLHRVTRLIVQGWPNAKLRDLLPDRMLVTHPERYAGDDVVGTVEAAAPNSKPIDGCAQARE